MYVEEFIINFVEPNTLIRLWYKLPKCQHKEVIKGDKPMMEWEILKSEYKNNIAVGVTDILYHNSPYVEAVNLIIKEK